MSLDPRMYSKWRARPWRVSHMMILVAAVALMLWIAVLAAGILVIAFLIFSGFLLFVFTLAMGTGVILARRSSTRQDSLLWLLAIAAERDMPMAPAAVAFAEQYSGMAYRRIMDLAAHLNEGIPLPQALEQARRVVARRGSAGVGRRGGRHASEGAAPGRRSAVVLAFSLDGDRHANRLYHGAPSGDPGDHRFYLLLRPSQARGDHLGF